MNRERVQKFLDRFEELTNMIETHNTNPVKCNYEANYLDYEINNMRDVFMKIAEEENMWLPEFVKDELKINKEKHLRLL